MSWAKRKMRGIVKNLKMEPCPCCRLEHNNPDGWVIMDKTTGKSLYHLDLTTGNPQIVEIPVEMNAELHKA